MSRDDAVFGLGASPGLGAWSRPAGWMRRAGARLVDTLLLLFPSYLAVDFLVVRAMGLPVTMGQDPAVEVTGDVLIGDMAAAFLLFGIWLAYESLCVAHWGQTPGKMLLGIKIIPVNEDTVPMGVPLGTAASRAVLLNIPTAAAWAPSTLVGVLNGFVLLAILWPLWDRPLRQGLHDKLVRTRVVHATVPRYSYPAPDHRKT